YMQNQDGRIDQCYPAWHRAASVGRFLELGEARALSCIDLDAALYVEYENAGRVPVVLIETMMDRWPDDPQPFKPATVLQNLARLADLPAYTVAYLPSRKPNAADPRWPDIVRFRVRRLWPQPETGWRTLTPAQYAAGLRKARVWSESRVRARFARFRNLVVPKPAASALDYTEIKF
ncbi:MAG: hypothetical protein ACREEM_54520, partial [Blastocatellia bacterium]